MRKLTILIFLFVTLIGCATTMQTTQTNQEVDRVILTNYIFETRIIGEGTFNDQEKNISVTVKPKDARKFDQVISSGNYYGGEHKSVLINKNATQSSLNKYELLIEKLLDEGLSFEDIRTIIIIIDENLDASDDLYVYTDPDIHINNIYEVNESNPFAADGRYLTTVELEISNNSSEPQLFCEDNILITSNSNSYSNVPTDNFLNSIPTNSLRYELLHKFLMKDCKTVPANTTINTHLIYPSFYDKSEIIVHYINDETVLQEEFQIDRVWSTFKYNFSKLKIEGGRNRGYRIISGNDTYTQNNIPSAKADGYHFVKFGNSIEYVGFQEFYIHEEINFEAVEIITVRFKNDKDAEILKTPLTNQAINNGSISIGN